jgi:hypothetical protein
MGCPTEVEIGKTLKFSIVTHDASTQARTDADSLPTYTVYEQEETGTGSPGGGVVASGSMAKLDDPNTTGLYVETLDITSGNGYENGVGYTIDIDAIVGGTTGGISYEFIAYDRRLADTTAISGDAIAADNLEKQYDETGLTGDNFPSKQSQLNNISTGSAAINTTATSGTTVTTGSETLTYTATHELDDSYHEIAPVGSVIEMYYEFDIGPNAAPVSALWQGYVNTNNDNVEVYAYNWSGTSWDQIDTIAGTISSIRRDETFNYTSAHVGTGANAGLVRLRFASSGADVATNLATDRLLTSYTTTTQSTGYENGAIWVDTNGSNTNTTDYVDGVADNPVSTWAAALTLSASLGIKHFEIINGSSITLTANSDNYTLEGDAWTLALGSQSISGMHVRGADPITGIGTGATSPDFHDCIFGAVTLPPSKFELCGFGDSSGTFTAGTNGQYIFHKCFSVVPGSGSPTFNFAGTGDTTGINNRGWNGGATYTLDTNCTLSHEVAEGGGTTVTTGGADVEIRGITRSVTLTLSNAGTCQFVGITGPITISGTATSTVNLYGVSSSLTDTSSGTTVNDETNRSTCVEGTSSFFQDFFTVDSTQVSGDEVSGSAILETAKVVWDRVLTAANHNIASSAGRRLRDIASAVIWTGDAVSSTASTITLDATASASDGSYDPAQVLITEGTGSGQVRTILEYFGSGGGNGNPARTAVIDRDWKVNPNGTSKVSIAAVDGRISTNEGQLRAATSTTAQLNSLAPSTNDVLNGQTIQFRSGTGQDQSALIKDYDGGTQTATFSKTLAVTPDATTGYIILPVGEVTLEAIQYDTQSVTDLKDFADAGYDPDTNKVQGVVLVDGLSAAERNAISDALLIRDVSNVEDSANTHSLTTTILASLESSLSGTTWTIRKTDGTTFTTKTVTTDDTADPITGVT